MAKRSTNWDDGAGIDRLTVGSDKVEKVALVDGNGNQIIDGANSGTTTLTTVADSASSVTLLALNFLRYGATITNDSSARLYIKLGATASTTSYTVSLEQHGYYEVPFRYTGRIDGIWASDPGDGAARVTELTA